MRHLHDLFALRPAIPGRRLFGRMSAKTDVTRETGWIIERKPTNSGVHAGFPYWVTINERGFNVLTDNAEEALRFARRRDATMYMNAHLSGPLSDDPVLFFPTRYKEAAP